MMPTPSTPGDIRISITNEGASSFSLTPLWFGFHDGGFDVFDVGAAASASLESLAEDGMTAGLEGDFEALGALGDRQGEANSTMALGAVLHGSAPPDEARKHYERALAIYREIGDRKGVAYACGNLGIITRIE